jgi:hypothetical protein
MSPETVRVMEGLRRVILHSGAYVLREARGDVALLRMLRDFDVRRRRLLDMRCGVGSFGVTTGRDGQVA